ncbi:unnamed protein product [Laminaria digitata]
MGHSMGCITAATVSLDPSLPPEQTTLVVVSPALFLPSKKQMKKSKSARSAAAPGVVPPGGAPLEVPPEAPQAPLESRARRGRGRGRGTGRGGRGLAEAVVGAPASAVRAVRDVGAWVFNWCLLPALYPFEILGLRALVYRGNFWRRALRLAW